MTQENTSAESEPSDTMRRRGEENRLKLWVLLEANRWVVAGVVVAGFFAGVLLIAALVPGQTTLSQGDPIETLFQGLVTATITGVTLVVSINSLVLSQELGTLGDQRDRMEGSMSFRRAVEDELSLDVASATPAAFLRELVDAVESRATRLADATERSESEPVGAKIVQTYADDLVQHASSVREDLSDRQFGTFGVLSAALDFNYSWKIHEARRLRTELGGDDGASDGDDAEANDGDADAGASNGDADVEANDGDADSGDPAEIRQALDDVVSVLTLFGPAREHFKTLYFQWELVDLSRAMLYSAIPALVVATGTLLFHGSLTGLSATTLGITHIVWVVALAAAVALAPFAILLAFVLRIGTVAKRTLSIGPFILRTTSDGERSNDGERSSDGASETDESG